MKHSRRFSLTCGPYQWKVHEVHMEIIDQCIGIALYSVDIYTSAQIDAGDVHGLNALLYDRSELVAENLVLNVARLANSQGQSAFRVEIEAIERIHGLAELGGRRPFEVASLRVRCEHGSIDIEPDDVDLEGDVTVVRTAPATSPRASDAPPPPLLVSAVASGGVAPSWRTFDVPEGTRTELLRADVLASVTETQVLVQTLRLTPGIPPRYELEPTQLLPVSAVPGPALVEPNFEITQRVRFTELRDLHWKPE